MNTEIKTEKKRSYELPLEVMLHDAKMQERKGRAELMASRLEVLAWKISRDELSFKEASELLRQEAEKFENEARGLH
ncbi:MAG: hypothetical protein H6R25_3373 [Proteobacteria bacterium]|uniref:DUF2732 family protein n=1 Tax=Kosakonia radicincitans TaxID=283686 RepID=UPI0022B5069C|nr:DUF2732 family protein [Kosakonia radicincitans]MBS1206474.1 hypothetical protein [Pseudomonadota bacterium]